MLIFKILINYLQIIKFYDPEKKRIYKGSIMRVTKSTGISLMFNKKPNTLKKKKCIKKILFKSINKWTLFIDESYNKHKSTFFYVKNIKCKILICKYSNYLQQKAKCIKQIV